MEEHIVTMTGGQEVGGLLYRAASGTTNASFVLAHGAGAGHTSIFIRQFAEGFADRGIDVFTFNFPYIENGRRIPDRAETLEACFEAAIRKCYALPGTGRRVFIGGKSLGGRIASHLAAREAISLGDSLPKIAGLILLGYPLRPPGKPDQLRTGHLSRITVPTFVAQGERDAFGSPEELRPWFNRPGVIIWPIPAADHSFKVPRSLGRSQAEILAEIQDEIAGWIAAN